MTDSEGNPVDFSPKAIDQADFSDQKGKDFLEIMYGNLPFTKAYVDMFEAIKEFSIEDIKFALDTDDKLIREERLKPVYEAIGFQFQEELS